MCAEDNMIVKTGKLKEKHLDFIFPLSPNVNMSVPFDLLYVCTDVRYLFGR